MVQAAVEPAGGWNEWGSIVVSHIGNSGAKLRGALQATEKIPASHMAISRGRWRVLSPWKLASLPLFIRLPIPTAISLKWPLGCGWNRPPNGWGCPHPGSSAPDGHRGSVTMTSPVPRPGKMLKRDLSYKLLLFSLCQTHSRGSRLTCGPLPRARPCTFRDSKCHSCSSHRRPGRRQAVLSSFHTLILMKPLQSGQDSEPCLQTGTWRL